MYDETPDLFSEQDATSEKSTLASPGRGTCQIIVGDTRKALTNIEAATFQTCVTSPPYWGLRDYNIDGQIGAEVLLDNYIQDLVGRLAIRSLF